MIVCCTKCTLVDSDMPFTMCLECLRRGAEKEDHKRNHPYYIMDRLEWPVFTKSWSAIDDLMLLKGVSTCGLDNWEEISETLGLKSGGDCASHFYSHYQSKEEVKDIITLGRDGNNKPIVIDDSLNRNREVEFTKNKHDTDKKEFEEVQRRMRD